MKKIALFFAVGLFIIAGTAAVNAQTVGGSIGNGTAVRGRATQARITLSIPGGLHVNSNRPSGEYSIPTTVRLNGRGVKVSSVRYPRGKNRRFQFSNEPINVYEGRVTFPFTVTVPSDFKGSQIRITAVVRYQACTDEVCYPPTNKEVTLTARVR